MIKQYFDNISKHDEVRKNLIHLRQALKDDRVMPEFEQLMQQYHDMMGQLLSDSDAKVRKNAALILGESGDKEYLKLIYDAYTKEEQLFVRASYLIAMSQFDYRIYVDELKQRMDELMNTNMTIENQKHLSEELRLLRDMVMKLDVTKKHMFDGYHTMSDVILLTSPGLESLTKQQLPKELQAKAKDMNGGICVRTDVIESLLPIRTVKGMLFRFCQNPLPANDHEAVADYLVKSGLLEFLIKRHWGEPPFFFRIDLKTHMVLNEKSNYVKRLANAIEQKSGYQLQNSASNYECELRMIENKKGQFFVYLKLNTIPDVRFKYRKYSLATSMHPVRAAEVVQLAKAYMSENAYVFDPFCGTGTLLLERQRMLPAKGMYGTDIFGEAIELARLNAEQAKEDINFINRDFADFKPTYLFDEVLTELPSASEKMTEEMLYQMYRIFVNKLPKWLQPNGVAVVVTTQEEWLLKLAKLHKNITVDAVYGLSGKRKTAVVVLLMHE